MDDTQKDILKAHLRSSLMLAKNLTLCDKTDKELIDIVADQLLLRGVVVPPCKVGKTLYFLYDNTFANRPNSKPHIYETKDWYFDIDEKGTSILPRSIHSYKGKHHYYLGETVFLTKEEAEKALEGQKK